VLLLLGCTSSAQVGDMRWRLLVELAVVATALCAARCGTREAAGGSMDAGTGNNGGNVDGGSDGSAATGGTSTDGGSGGTSAGEDCAGLRAASDPGAATPSHFIWLRDSTGVDPCSPAVASGTGGLALTMNGYHSQTIDFVSRPE